MIHRPVDKERIDANLRKGSLERKRYSEYLRQKHSGKTNLLEYQPLPLETNQHITAEVSTHPTTPGKHQIYQHDEIKILPAETTEINHSKGVVVLKSLEPENLLDVQLSQPLLEPPTGAYGSTLITSKVSGSLNPTSGLINEPIPVPAVSKPIITTINPNNNIVKITHPK